MGLHFQFIWTLRDKELQKKAIFDMQKFLSSTGAQGGNVIIFKDGKASGKSNDVPCKPSFKLEVEAWGRSYIGAFGEHHVTHYIVSTTSWMPLCFYFNLEGYIA